MPKPLFIAIGVHKAKLMALLEGVLPSVDRLASWALGNGYEVIQIDDRASPVTVDRIKDELTPKLAQGDRAPSRLIGRERIVVYFCGHGMHAPQDQYWILSAGPNQPNERISAIGFRDMLATYGPRQISMISDACRSAQVVQGLASSVIDANESLAGTTQKDNFFSSQDGEASFAVPPSNGNQGYCIFSSVLLRALCKPIDFEALDTLYLQIGRKVVSSQSLATYLEQKVPDAALNVGKLQVPQCDPGFRPTINDYIEFANAQQPVSLQQDEIVARQENSDAKRAVAQNDRINLSRSEWRRPYVEDMQRFLGAVLGDVSQQERCWPLLLTSNSGALQLLGVATYSAFRKIDIRLPDEATRQQWQLLCLPLGGFAVSGRSSVVLVRTADLVAAIPLFHTLWCTARIDKSSAVNGQVGGVELLAWGPRYPPPATVGLSAAEALKGLSARTLTSEDVAVLTRDMRQVKHADPMYGIVSAYLYNGIGDIENIRRMCYYYFERGQDVPFDIALLAQLELKARPDGGFVVEVPEVKELPEPLRPPDAPYFVWEATRSVTVNVAGVTPLLRAGWQHIRTSKHAVHQKCWELTDHLTESPVSTFSGADVAARLTKIFQELADASRLRSRD